MTEKVLQDFFIKKCRQANLLAYKVVCVGRRGFPDVQVINPDGRIVFVELKHPNGKGKLSVQQVKTITELKEHNCHVEVIHTKAQCIKLIDTLREPDR